jgi:hypothetical protein
MSDKTQSVRNKSAFGCMAAKTPFYRSSEKSLVKSMKTLDTYFFDGPTKIV